MPQPGLRLSREIAAEVTVAGGKAYLAGGAVRDLLLGREGRDVDLEVYGIEDDRLERILRRFGKVVLAGRQHAVWRVGPSGGVVDVASGGARSDEDALRAACLRRDLTVNALLFDPLDGRVVDLVGGMHDLVARRLRPCSRAFLDDPLRPLRVMRFAGTLEMAVTPEAVSLSRRAEVERAAPDRVFSELSKLLLEARKPSLGLRWIVGLALGRVFPELVELNGLPQDPEWHPEGDVWTHTLRVVDAAALERVGDPDRDLPVMLAALLHDIGKAGTTFMGCDGRVRSPAHDERGADLARGFLDRLGRRGGLSEAVVALVREHLRPSQLAKARTVSDGALRRLVERVPSLELLGRVARADHLGRTTEDALAGRFEAGDWLSRRASDLGVAAAPLPPLLLGRDLLALGLPPGPEVGRLLRLVREAQLDGRISTREEALEVVHRAIGRGAGP